MADFNILAALGKELSKDKIEPRAPRDPALNNPDRMSWPYLKYSELKAGTDYMIRFLPPHPERCPLGYVKKQMYQFAYEIDTEKKGGWAKHSSHYVMAPGCLDPKAEDPIKDILRDIYDRAKSETEEGQELRDIIQNDEEFKEFLTAMTKTWTQYLFPVIVYARCDEGKSPDGKYPRYSNYVPDRKMTTMQLRILQMNDVQVVRDEVTKMLVDRIPVIDEETQEVVGYEGFWTDAVEGCGVKFKHTTTTPKSYSFIPSEVRTELPDSFLEKLNMEGNYPDLITRELKNSFKKPDEMLNMLKNCPMTDKYLIPLGFIK